MADGVAPKDVYKTLGTEAGVERAFKKLDQIKANIVWWEKGSQPPQLLASGEVAMTDAYNGRIAAANDEGEEELQDRLDEQSLHDRLVGDHEGHAEQGRRREVPGVRQRSATTRRICRRRFPYGVTTKAATALIDKNVLPNLATAPENLASALSINDKFWLENLDKLNQRFNAWVAK